MKRKRTHIWDDPLIGSKQAMKMSGIEYIHAMLEGSIPAPPILQTLDFNIVSIEVGKAVFSFVPQEFHYNPIGTVHGGVISTILDTAMGSAVHSLLPVGKSYTTLELKVNFLKAITSTSGELLSIGTIIHSGGRTALAEAKIVDTDGKVYAYSTSTCLIFGTE